MRARDEVKDRPFVTSLRLGAATRPTIVVPAIAAVTARGIDAKIVFYRPTGKIVSLDLAEIVLDAAEEGVKIRPVREPRVHAEILAWDGDSVLITSQNRLSADPSDSNCRGEIGIFIRAPGAANYVLERFEKL
jgi:cardiolipin synthase